MIGRLIDVELANIMLKRASLCLYGSGACGDGWTPIERWEVVRHGCGIRLVMRMARTVKVRKKVDEM